MGACIVLIAAAPLIRLGRGSPIRKRAVTVYAACAFANLAISGIYHALAWHCAARALFQRFDHFAIWLMIAGTFTAIHGVTCRGFWRGGVLAIIWTYAACGVALQVLWFHVFASRPGLLLYLGFGWLGLVSFVKIGRDIGYRAVCPILYAGITITAGALLENFARGQVFVDHWVTSHEVFHLAVLVGLALHWRLVRQLLIRAQPRGDGAAAGTARTQTPAEDAEPTLGQLIGEDGSTSVSAKLTVS